MEPAPQLLLLLLSTSAANCLVLTADQKTDALNAHNRLRRSVYPSAADMNYLTWNSRLEDLAQRAANRCVFEHNYAGDYASLGENLYLGARTNATEIVTLFYMESLAYDYAAGTCGKANALNYSVCGHYLQVVGAKVAEVACAIAACDGGNNLMVCEYDKIYSAPVYTSGSPCSNCSGGGFCLDGLCLNGSMRNYLVNSFNSSVSCSMGCRNCASRVELLLPASATCACICPSGYTSGDCSIKRLPSAPALTCGLCAQLGTPCQNGGADNSSATRCGCTCPVNVTGPQCQIPVDAYNNAINLQLRNGNTICSNGRCAAVPINPTSFATQVWPTLQAALLSGVNAFCAAPANLAQCCGVGATPAPGGPSGAFLQAGDLRYVDFSVAPNSGGGLSVAIYAGAQSDNALCAAASPGRRRRRAAASSTPVPLTLLSAALAAANGTISSNLSSCCGIAVDSASSFRAAADALFGVSSGSSDGGASSVGAAGTTPSGGSGTTPSAAGTPAANSGLGFGEMLGHRFAILLAPAVQAATTLVAVILRC